MNEIASTAPARDSSASTVAPAATVDAAIPIIGVGTSAGGLEALERFFSKVPATCGYAFVVVQHLDPTQKALLVELLRRCTPLPVVEITDALTVERDHIYVIPPNCDIATTDGRWFAIRILPYRTHDHRADGVVLTFSDITRAKALENERRETRAALEVRLVEQSVTPPSRDVRDEAH